MHFETLDIGLIVLYLSVLLIIGVIFIFRTTNPERFMVGERSVSGIVLGLSNAATQNSSIGFLLIPAAAYYGNWVMLGATFSIPVVGWVVTKYIVPFFRERKDISAYSYLSERFGPWAMFYAVILFTLSRIMRCGLIVYYLAYGLAPLTGFNEEAIILVTGIVVIFYTYMGGLEAVIWTECMQTFLLIGGLLASIFFIFHIMPGGMSHVLSIASQSDKISLGSWDLDFLAASVWVYFFFGLVADLFEFSFSQMFVQRYIAARSDRDAKVSVWMGLSLSTLIVLLFLTIGTSLFAYYHIHPNLLTPDELAEGNLIYAHFIGKQIPNGLLGLLVVAFLSAAMGSIDSNLISASTVFFCNVYKPYFKPNHLTSRDAMKVLHVSSLVVGAGAILVAFGFSFVEQHAMEIWFKIMGVMYGGVLGLFLIGMGSKKIGNGIAITAVTIGTIVIVWIGGGPYFEQIWEGFGAWRLPLNGLMSLFVGTVVILVIGFGAALFVKEKPKQ